MRRANGTGGCYGRKFSGLSKLISFEMGLQIRKYHVVFIPKKRRKALFGQARRYLGEIFHALARQKECQILEGHLMPDHVHVCIAIPPKYAVVSVIGYLEGKSAIAIAGQLCGKERNFTGEHLWARGYAVSTVGFEIEQVRQYIRDQEEADGTGEQF
jgi:putative transposase